MVACKPLEAGHVAIIARTGSDFLKVGHCKQINRPNNPPRIFTRIFDESPPQGAKAELYVSQELIESSKGFIRHSPDRTTFPGYSSRRDAANYNLAFQGRQMRPDSLKFLLPWTNHRPAKRKISKPLVYDQVSSLGSPFALYDPVTVINPDAPKVD